MGNREAFGFSLFPFSFVRLSRNTAVNAAKGKSGVETYENEQAPRFNSEVEILTRVFNAFASYFQGT